MHYRNGTPAANGDKIVMIKIFGSQPGLRTGVLIDAVPGQDYCNGTLVPLEGGSPEGACLVDCLRLDEALEMLGGAARPPGK